jgi:hypothetical protein
MDNTLTPVSDIEQMKGSLFLWKTSWLLSHATKECEVANFHGQASDAYAYVYFIFMDNTLKPVSYIEQM